MKNLLLKVYNFIVYSSENPENFSLTLKGAVPFVILFLSWSHFGQGIDAGALNNGIDAVVSAIVKAGEFATAAITAYGLIRKIINSVA